MIQKKVLLAVILILSMVIVSCSTINGIFGKSAKAETVSKTKVEDVQKAQNKNLQQLMDEVAILACGTDYALNKVTNREPPINVAQDINKRVISLAGKPNLEAEKEMWKMVDQLLSQMETERQLGIKALNKKDKEISELQDDTKILAAAKDEEISKYMKQAAETARISDSRKAELDDYKGWFGLKAVGKGLWQFVTSSMWILGIGGILFLVLRLAAASNPICGAIFSIFEQVVAWGINAIRVVFPKSLSFAGHVTKEAYDISQNLLTKIVDSLQYIKTIEKTTGKDITVKELLAELAKTMDKAEKDVIDKLKKDLGY